MPDTTQWLPNLGDLRRLYDETNAVLDSLRDHPENRPSDVQNEAISWARVRCIDAMACLSHDGGTSTRVEIASASEAANGLRQYLSDQLEARGFAGVAVDTRW